MKRVFAVALAGLLCAAAGDFAILNIRVVEGEGIVYALGSRATRGLTVEVTDETGRPVPDVTVSFRLPDDGASGTFASGSHTEVMTTRQDGRVAVWGMKWNRTPGTVQLRVTAVKDGVRAGLVSVQHLSDVPAAAGAPRVAGRGMSKLLLVGIVIAGAGGGLALGMSRSPQAAQTPVAAPVGISVGAPSVIVGAPK